MSDCKRLLDYMEKNQIVGVFGVDYLDQKLKGILKNDLIVIGARSGAGKSTLSTIIATANAKKGTTVALFSLENFPDDNFVEKAFYHYRYLTQDYTLSLREFASGNFDKDLDALTKSQAYAEKCFENIKMINRQAKFDIEDIKKQIVLCSQEGYKLIILDHLDYVDKYGNDTDYTHINSLMKTIREAQDAFNVAIVAISHLRKNQSFKAPPKIPSVDEFIGSSNKVKEATCVIMFAPDDETNVDMVTNEGNDNIKCTWCCIRKLRMGGIDNKAAKLFFDVKTGTYLDNYRLYSVDYSGVNIKEIGA